MALSPAVLGYLRVQGAADPEDLTNEVFLSVLRGIGSFNGTEPQLRSWIFTIAPSPPAAGASRTTPPPPRARARAAVPLAAPRSPGSRPTSCRTRPAATPSTKRS